MKYIVGLQFNNNDYIDSIIKNKSHISEVYFSWGDFPNGRSSQLISDKLRPWELQKKQEEMLLSLSKNGIKLNLLFNANCYGNESMSWALFNKIGSVTEYVLEKYNLACVTTTSPMIAKFIKANFPELEVRASVNMEIGSIEGMKYIESYFDSYYMKREFNRDFRTIKKLHSWCKENGKKLYMLANSGCLNNCSVHNFHDNLVAHESGISKMDNAYHFQGICKEFLKKRENYGALIENTNFIRPEDVYKYEPYFEAVKLATRVHKSPRMVLESYVRAKYSGDILRLLEPAHSIYPYVIENGEPLKLVKIDTTGGSFDVKQ